MDAASVRRVHSCRTRRSRRTAKSCGSGAATLASTLAVSPASNGGKKGRSPGRARISRKAIARGKPGCPGCTCQSRVRSYYPIAHGNAGAVGARLSLRPFSGEGHRDATPRAKACRGNAACSRASIFILHCGRKLAHSTLPGSFWSSRLMSPQTMPSETESRANRAEDAQALEEDTRLRNDIRLLGRILGDTVRDQEGADVFDLVERIRQTSIRFHRDDDKPARRELELILDSMSISQTLRIVRAFSYFSHLANIAEDQNNIRQMRAKTAPGGAPNASLLNQTLAHASAAGIKAADLRRFFETAQVSPVLTAHPTEVRRKSTMDREMEIAGAARPPRAGAAHPGGSRGRGRAAAPRSGDAVADQSAAPDQAHRARRGRQRPVVLRLHVPARGAAAALRAGRPAQRGRRRGERRTGVVPEDGKLDRRRSRRQSVRHRRGHARHLEAACQPGAALLSRRAARARLRTVDGRASHRHLQGSAPARRTLAGQVAAS